MLAATAIMSLLALTLTACPAARAGTRCRTGFARDSTHILRCRNGRWVRLMTHADYARLVVSLTPTVTVDDPLGDVTKSVPTATWYGLPFPERSGEFPAIDPRADVIRYSIRFRDTLRFSLETAQIDPSLGPWLSFDTDDDTSGLPELAVFPTIEGFGLHELLPNSTNPTGQQWQFRCSARRAIEANAYVVEFDSACVSHIPVLRLRGWRWSTDRCVDAPAPPVCTTYSDDVAPSGPFQRSS